MRIKNKLNNLVHIRFDDNQFDFLQKQSIKSGLTISELIRTYVEYLRFKGAQNENNSRPI